jgi:hypothetical protein
MHVFGHGLVCVTMPSGKQPPIPVPRVRMPVPTHDRIR